MAITYTVYEIECREEGYRYVGQCVDIATRFERHVRGQSTAFIDRHRGLRSFRIVEEGIPDRKTAILRETLHARQLLIEGWIVGGPFSSDLWSETQLRQYRQRGGPQPQGAARGATYAG